MTTSVDVYLVEEELCHISSDPIWNDRALGFFKDGRSNDIKKNSNKKNKMST